MVRLIQNLTIRFIILTLIGGSSHFPTKDSFSAAEAFSMSQQQQPPPKTIYGVPNSGWTSPEWNWGYAVGTGHDCAAICRQKYASSDERSKLIEDLLAAGAGDETDLEEVKLVLT